MYVPEQAYNGLIFKQQKQQKIEANYQSILNNLLYDAEKDKLKGPICIGDKDVYALSDIEGYNIDFLDFLNKLGLVEYTTDRSKAQAGWKSCSSLKKDGVSYDKGFPELRVATVPVYYKFNEEACRKFNDVIVLCGDYVRNSKNVSEGTVQILEELRSLLNFDEQGVGCGTEDKKKLFLIAGNHDIADYDPNVELPQHDLKRRVLDLGLYPQLLLVNGEGKRLLFQHTNFPYLANDNFIVNKKIDPGKAIELLKNNNPWDKRMLSDDGFFNLRYIAKQGDLTPQYYGCNDTLHESPLQREIYSDFGIGYDAKFVGHDTEFYGCSMRPCDRGDVYNVNIGNRNEPSFVCWRSNQKQQQLQYNVQPNYKKIGGKIYIRNNYMRNNYDAIQDKEWKKYLYNLRHNQLLTTNPPKYY